MNKTPNSVVAGGLIRPRRAHFKSRVDGRVRKGSGLADRKLTMTSNTAADSPCFFRAEEHVTHRAREYVVHPLNVLRAQQDVVERLHPRGHDEFVV